MVARSVVARRYEEPRRRLVEHLREQGIDDLAVLHAFDAVPRHLFVPASLRHQAYQDVALPIGFGQTISRPTTHAFTLQCLRLSSRERVLEVGTGSGFQTALLSCLAAHVHSVERIPALARRARDLLEELRIRNVTVQIGDGALGWKAHAPYDAILVSARASTVPEPLLDQLGPGGQLLIPLGPDRHDQQLFLVRRDHQGRVILSALRDSRFVPLV